MTRLALLPITAIVCLAALLSTLPVRAQTLEEIDRLVGQGAFPQALDRVNAYLASRPKDAQGRFLKGIILTEMSKPTEAIQIFTGLTEDYPELPEPYNNLAVLYASQGQFDKARVALELAIHTHPSYATAHENLGDIYAKLASRAYDKALQLDKSNATAQAKLSLVKDLFSDKAGRVNVAKAEATKPAAVATDTPSPTPKPAPVAAPAGPAPTATAVPANNTTAPAPTRTAKQEGSQSSGVVSTGAVKAAPTPTPAEAPAPAPAASENKSSESDIIATLDAWAKAWSNKSVKSYLSYYAPDFTPPDGSSRAKWEAQRKQRISKPGPIQVSLNYQDITIDGDDAATVSVKQAYRSNNLSSTNRKTIRLVRVGERWLIKEERVEN